MMRFYVVPKIGDGLTIQTPFRPKYTDLNALGAGWNVGAWQAMDYGLENVFLLAVDLDATQHATLSAQADVLSVPSPITNNVGAGAVSVAQNKLEAGNIPAGWVTTALTWQQVLSRVIRIVMFMQRCRGIFGKLFKAGITLDSTISQLPTNPINVRQLLNDAAQSMGADTSSVTLATPIRSALVVVADQIQPGGILFGGVTF